MLFDIVSTHFSPFVNFSKKYKRSKQLSLAAILKNRQLVNSAPYLLARQPIKMLKNIIYKRNYTNKWLKFNFNSRQREITYCMSQQ